MSDKVNTGNVAYIYDEATDKWYSISGAVNTAAAYTWTATQTFVNTVLLNDVVNAKAGVNNFLNPAARDTAIPSPSNGIVCFVRQDASGNVINQIQYYYNGSWRSVNDSTTLSAKTDNYTLALSDAGNTITMSSSSQKYITVPANSDVPFPIGTRLDVLALGTGLVSLTEGVGVTINSKNGNKDIAAQYSGASLVKINTNTWILVGDLTGPAGPSGPV